MSILAVLGGLKENSVSASNVLRSRVLRLLALVVMALALVAPTTGQAFAAGSPGGVYVLTNQTSGNAVAMYNRAADGTLTLTGTVSTGGLGTGAGLGSQGALALSDDGRWLFAVNAGSNQVSVFEVRSDGLVLTDTVPSGGNRPTSLTFRKGLLYVLNAGASGNITGFTLAHDGRLTPLAGSQRPLSNGGNGAAPAPAQVLFSQNGDVLVVTERSSNLIDVFTLGPDGLAISAAAFPSSGGTPFGAAFTQQNTLVVSEAFGGAAGASAVSSYTASAAGLGVISASAPTGQTAACWMAVSKNGKFAYSANAGSASVSAYQVGNDGSLTLLNGRAGDTGAGTAPIDMATSHDSQYLSVLSARSQNVIAFATDASGGLTPIGSFGGLPLGTGGIVAW